MRAWRLIVSTDPDGKNIVQTINFGIVKENNKRTLLLYLKNLEDYTVEKVVITSPNKDLEIEYPDFIPSFETAIMKLSWKVTEETIALEDALQFRGEILKT